MIDKKLVSVNHLSYNVGLHDENISIITGKILSVCLTRNFTILTIIFAYFDDLGAEISRSTWTVEGETEINALWAQVLPLMPQEKIYLKDELTKYYLCFMITAAETWNIRAADWLIIDDIPV